MKILVTIASYGSGNDPYLERLIAEYRSMPHQADIVVLSNISKQMPAGIELVVGMPTSDPWSLPFAHKQVLAERREQYDLFIYSENDILITSKNIDAFLWATSVLPEDEIAGFLRTESGPGGQRYYPDVNKMYHWDPQSVAERGHQLFAAFTCEHAGCYMLTREQLRRAIASGGFLVAPHQGKFDLACTAATDPYTQCGFRKAVCISNLDGFLVPHLSNKYVGTDYDLSGADFDLQLEALCEIHEGRRSAAQLLNTETAFPLQKLSKSYYEPARQDILDLIPAEAQTVLSLGCGWGELEGRLVKRGIRVTGVPLDSVISACAEARGIATVTPNFEAAWKELEKRKFDCVLVSNILHLVPDGCSILRECNRLLRDGGRILLISPNFRYLKVAWQRMMARPQHEESRASDRTTKVGSKNESKGDWGVRSTTRQLVLQWMKSCGLRVDQVVEVVPKRARPFSRLSKIARTYLSSEFLVLGHKASARQAATDSQSSEKRIASETASIASA